MKCMTSFFDNVDLIRRFVDDESQADKIETSSTDNVDRIQRELIPRTSGLVRHILASVSFIHLSITN